MIGSLVAVVFWLAFVAVIRHEAKAQRAEWGPLQEFAAWREELNR